MLRNLTLEATREFRQCIFQSGPVSDQRRVDVEHPNNIITCLLGRVGGGFPTVSVSPRLPNTVEPT